MDKRCMARIGKDRRKRQGAGQAAAGLGYSASRRHPNAAIVTTTHKTSGNNAYEDKRMRAMTKKAYKTAPPFPNTEDSVLSRPGKGTSSSKGTVTTTMRR